MNTIHTLMIVKPHTNKFLTFNTSKPNQKLNENNLCIPASFNTNISHQLLDNKKTFMNSQN